MYQKATYLILQRAQIDSFPDNYALLRAGKPVPASSHLITLSPEFDTASGLIRVGGRLHRAEELDPSAVHPVILDPHHQMKIGCRTEKRWGLLFKCLMSRAVYLDLLTALYSDAFLMALRRFTARCGTPTKLYSDQGTNFHGAERELATVFAEMHPRDAPR
eukprot:superscaffoldBa00000873_g7733